MKRIVIIGNSGSGKSFLAKRMSAPTGAPVINLDQLSLVPGGSGEERTATMVQTEIEAIKQGENWVVEGVSGALAERFLDRADYLIWLDLPWLSCRDGLLLRALETASLPDPVKAEEDLQDLFVEAEGYWTRADSRSYIGHQGLFDQFPRAKDRIVHRGCAEALYDED